MCNHNRLWRDKSSFSQASHQKCRCWAQSPQPRLWSLSVWQAGGAGGTLCPAHSANTSRFLLDLWLGASLKSPVLLMSLPAREASALKEGSPEVWVSSLRAALQTVVTRNSSEYLKLFFSSALGSGFPASPLQKSRVIAAGTLVLPPLLTVLVSPPGWPFSTHIGWAPSARQGSDALHLGSATAGTLQSGAHHDPVEDLNAMSPPPASPRRAPVLFPPLSQC